MSTASSSTSPSTAPRHTFSLFLLIVANLLWATSYVAGKFILQDISATMLSALRMCLASVFLVPLLLYKRKEIHLTWRDIPQLLLLALVGFVINKWLEYGGLALTTASDVALLISSESVFTAAFAWILLRERFQLLRASLMLLGLLGVYLIVERSFLPTLPSGGGVWRMAGDVLVVLALIFESFYTIRGKSLLTKHSPLLIISAAIVGSTLFWLPVAGWQILSFGWPQLSMLGWISLGWMALIATVFGYLAWFQGLAKVDGSVAAVTLFIQPLAGTALAVLLLHEHITLLTLLGGVLIMISVFLLSRH